MTPPDPKDVRVLIPRVRRAIDGPTADGPGAPTTSLDDAQLAALIADAVAEVIFYTSGLFPHELVVVDRDDSYGAPVGWQVDPELTDAETSVVIAQAALNFFFYSLSTTKTQETIRDEGQEWSWQLSATALMERIKELRATRDKAIALVQDANGGSAVYFHSFLLERDRFTALLVEPQIGVGLPGQAPGQVQF